MIDDLIKGTDELLTADDVARILKRTKRWVWDNARSGELPSIKVGNRFRFRRTELEAWLAGEAER